jgi:hypothetical protein
MQRGEGQKGSGEGRAIGFFRALALEYAMSSQRKSSEHEGDGESSY